MQIIQKCKRPVFAFDLILFFIIGIVCSSQQSDSLDLSAIVQLTPQDASELVNDTSVTILDVRTINEYKAGHIGKAIVIPVQELQERVSEIEHLKNSKVSGLLPDRSSHQESIADIAAEWFFSVVSFRKRNQTLDTGGI